MKVKIKGLVFVGFAAAVFAQSAMADITPVAADKKVVASKYYVDDVFQPNADRVTAAPEAGSNDWNSTDKYPSMAVLKAKFDALTPAVGSNAANYVDFTESGDTLTVNFDNAPATTAAELTGTLTNGVGATLSGTAAQKLVTTGAVNALIDGEETSGNTTIDQNSTNGTVPTSKNVYDFVTGQVSGAAYQPKDDTQATASSVRVGYNSDGNTPGWGSLAGASGGYVAISGSNGVYTVDIDSANKVSDQITSSSDGSTKLATENAVYDYAEAQANKLTSTTPISSASTDVQYPSAKNVYDFVNGNYQPKTTGTDVMVGYNGTWRSLGGDSYITVAADGSSSSVTLTNMTAHGVDDTGTNPTYTSDFVAAGATGASTKRPMLARAGDVYDFVMDQLGGLAIPEMPVECTTAATNGGYCALVYGAKTGGGNALQWTVMAPEPASGNGGGNSGGGE